MTGYRESELVTICNEVHPNIVVPFKIYECSSYYDKNRPDWEQMQKLAINLSSPPMKPVGFKTSVGFQDTRKLVPVTNADEDEE